MSNVVRAELANAHGGESNVQCCAHSTGTWARASSASVGRTSTACTAHVRVCVVCTLQHTRVGVLLPPSTSRSPTTAATSPLTPHFPSITAAGRKAPVAKGKAREMALLTIPPRYQHHTHAPAPPPPPNVGRCEAR